MPGTVELAIALAGLLIVIGIVVWLVRMGAKVERAAMLEDDVEEHSEAHRRAEEFSRGGGLHGGIERARAARQRLREAARKRDVR